MRFVNLWRAALAELWQERGFGLYVHWPFCAAKCPYCDFNSHVRSGVDQSRWADALCHEIRRSASGTGPRVLSSVFFGGGTPSLMEPETVKAVLDTARDVWVFANDIEITLEANPTSVEAHRFEAYAKHGVNRVSLGVQSLVPKDLKILGRLHSVDEAQSAFNVARTFFDRVSFDLIYARQNQRLAAWEQELTFALNMAVDHLSLYQLTIEPGTAFWDRSQKGKLRGLPSDDLGADLFDLTQRLCEDAGYSAYEVSNHAKPGAESKHNLIYWRGGDYVGIGPGAHGRLSSNGSRLATECWAHPETWLAAVANGSGVQKETRLTALDISDERLIMGLRLSEGLYMGDVYQIIDMDCMNAFVSDGLLWANNDRIGATKTGRPVLNYIISQLAT